MLLPLLLLLATLSCAQDRRTALSTKNITGDVLAVFEYTYEPMIDGDGNWTAGNLRDASHTVEYFDEYGNLTEQRYVDGGYATDMLTEQTVSDGMPVSSVTYSERGEEVLRMAMINKDGRPWKREEFYPDGRRRQILHEFADEDHLNVQFTQDGSPTERLELTYAGHQLVSAITYGKFDSLKRSVVYTLDARGNPLSMTSTTPGGEGDYRIDYSDYVYDARGNWIERRHTVDGKPDALGRRRILYRDELEKPIRERLVGMWSVVDENNWIRLNPDGSFVAGRRKNVGYTGTWSIEGTDIFILTPRPDSQDAPTQRFSFAIDTFSVQLTSLDERDDIEFEMR